MTESAKSENNTPRVAIFTDAMPERNGAGAYYYDLVNQLAGRNVRVELFGPEKRERLLSALPLPGDPTQKLLIPNIFRLRKQYRALDPHIIISVTPGAFGLLGMHWSRRYRTTFLTAFHTHFEELARMYFGRCTAWLMNGYLKAVNKRLCRNSSAALVNNSNLVPLVKSLGARQVDIIGTPLADRFLQAPPVEAVKQLECALFAGRLAPEKNIDLIVAAAGRLPDIEFILAGDGPLYAELKAECRELRNVRITGWLDREELCRTMDRADLLLLPSKTETFGTVALESMARGRPALVAKNAGIHDWPMLAEGLIDWDPDEPLADALKRLRNMDGECWSGKSEAAREAALAFNERTIEHWLNLFKDHAGQRH